MIDSILPSQLRAARALVDLSQDALATMSGVSISTIRDFEAGRRDPAPENIRAMQDALKRSGVCLISLDKDGGPGVRLFSEMPKITKMPKGVSFETDNLVFRVSWRGTEVFILLPSTVLDDLDRTNYRGDAAYLAAFANHKEDILIKTARALYGGRLDHQGRLQLRSRDFFPRSE